MGEYTFVSNKKKIEVYYSLGEKSKIASPQGDYKAFDMYGNEMKSAEK